MGTVSSPDAQTRLVPGTTNNLPAKSAHGTTRPTGTSALTSAFDRTRYARFEFFAF
jgi:hypothetical protein